MKKKGKRFGPNEGRTRDLGVSIELVFNGELSIQHPGQQSSVFSHSDSISVELCGGLISEAP